MLGTTPASVVWSRRRRETRIGSPMRFGICPTAIGLERQQSSASNHPSPTSPQRFAPFYYTSSCRSDKDVLPQGSQGWRLREKKRGGGEDRIEIGSRSREWASLRPSDTGASRLREWTPLTGSQVLLCSCLGLSGKTLGRKARGVSFSAGLVLCGNGLQLGSVSSERMAISMEHTVYMGDQLS